MTRIIKRKPTMVENFRKMREILATPDRWIKRSFARTLKGTGGRNIDAKSPEAHCFCLLGVARHVTNNNFSPESDFLTRVVDFTRHDMPASFNDNSRTKHADVIQVLDDAIQICEALEFRQPDPKNRRFCLD